MIGALRAAAERIRPADEPFTTATDYLLAAEAAALAILLWRNASGEHARLVWAGAFAILAVGAFAGGSSHGYGSRLDPGTAGRLWRFALLCVAAAGTLWVGGGLTAYLSSASQVLGWSGLLVKLIVLAHRLRIAPAFRLVALDSGLNLALIAVLQVYGAWTLGAGGTLPILAGVGLSAVGALVQQRHHALHHRFNHNDLYHVIQMVALVCFFLGGRTLSDR